MVKKISISEIERNRKLYNKALRGGLEPQKHIFVPDKQGRGTKEDSRLCCWSGQKCMDWLLCAGLSEKNKDNLHFKIK